MKTLSDLGEWCTAHPWETALATAWTWFLAILVWFAIDVHPVFTVPGGLACWLLGVHIDIQMRGGV